MRHILERLDHLCIEIISKNIHRHSQTPKRSWLVRYCTELGERLILSCILNSFEKLDENIFEFILENFAIKKFKIFPKICEKIKYFDFLNKKSFDVFEVNLSKEIKIKDKKNFKLKTNKLFIHKQNCDNFLKSYEFFSNLLVEKEIKILNPIGIYDNEIERLMIILLNNTSKEMENIQVPNDNHSIEFYENFHKILNERRCLKDLFINFEEGLPDFMKISLFEYFLVSSPVIPNSSTSILSSKEFNNSLQSFNSFQNLCIRFSAKKNSKNIDKVFSYLKLLNIHNLKVLKISSLDGKLHGKEFHNFLIKCSNLETLVLTHSKIDGLTAINSDIQICKSLKILKLYSFRIENEIKLKMIKNLISHSSLQEICFYRISFGNEFCFQLLEFLENYQHTLTSLTIVQCRISVKTINFLPTLIRKFHKLESIYFDVLDIDDEILVEIFQSLQNSKKSLKSIAINRYFRKLRLENCSELISLFDNCQLLTSINLQIPLINDKDIPNFLLTFKKFETTLEDINLDFCWSEKYRKEILNFLTGCSQLIYVRGKILSNDEDLINELMPNLYNSRYTLKFVSNQSACNDIRYPYLINN